MTEFSYPWSGTATGDCGPYSDDQWSDMQQVLWQLNRAEDGVVGLEDNELLVTGTASPVAVATGKGLADGKFYKNDASVNVVIPTPTTNTRIDRIVLRKSWSAQTVRITRIAGTEGGSAPALVQTDGTTWDVPLAQASITTGGIITVTDERRFLGEFDILLPLGSVQGGLAVGDYADCPVPFEGKVGGWEITADASGSAVIDIRKSTYAAWSFSSIAGTEKPTLSTQQKNTDMALSTWTTSIARNDYIRAYCESVTTCKQVLVRLRCRKRK